MEGMDILKDCGRKVGEDVEEITLKEIKEGL